MDAARRSPRSLPKAAPRVGGVAVLACAVGWGLSQRGPDEPRPQPRGQTTATARIAAPTASRYSAAAVLTPSPAVAPRTSPRPGASEVCGYGWVQVPPDDPDPLQRIPPALRQAALEAMDAAMLASPDPRTRAAGLWMGARLRGREVPARIEQMVRLAVASPDPYVYAMALDACQGVGPAEGGACALLSRAQWVRLDPDNAVPWQALAAEARAHDEPGAENAALQLAAQAPRNDVHAGRLPQLVARAMGAQAAPLQRTLALSAGWSAEAVWAASHGAAAAAHGQGYDLSCDNVERLQRRAERAAVQELAGLK